MDVDLVGDMLIFDRLPRELRRALREASVDIGATDILGFYQEAGLDGALRAVHYTSNLEAAAWRAEMRSIRVKISLHRRSLPKVART